jgi:hypothetical protein
MKNENREIGGDLMLNGARCQSSSSLAGRTSEPEKTGRRPRWKWAMAGTLIIAVALALPSPAQSGIFSVFGELFGTIQNDMGSALSAINQGTQETHQLYQQTVWPLALVNQARGFVSSSITSYRSYMTQVFSLSSPSATVASSQQLETILHSRQSAQIPALQASFATNYGAVSPVTVASFSAKSSMLGLGEIRPGNAIRHGVNLRNAAPCKFPDTCRLWVLIQLRVNGAPCARSIRSGDWQMSNTLNPGTGDLRAK